MNQTDAPTQPISILYAGGGTGGHIFPALAIAAAFDTTAYTDVEHVVLCSNRAIDARILTSASIPFEPLAAQPFATRPRGFLRFVRSWGPSVRATRALIKAHKARGRTVILVSTGGFVSAPAVQAARVEKVPTLLVNLDAVPGKANRWVARRVDHVVSTLAIKSDHAVPLAPDVEIIGPVVRPAARASSDQRTCRTQIGLDPDQPVLMVTGGSQGAKTVNAYVVALAQHESRPLTGWQILHQCGDSAGEVERLTAAYAEAGIARAIVEPSVDAIGQWWGSATIAIGRGGAGTVSEAIVNNVPLIVLPYPWHADQHQARNAQQLVDAGAALVITDTTDAAQTIANAPEAFLALWQDPDAQDAMRNAYATLDATDGVDAVIRHMQSMIERATAGTQQHA